MLADYFYNKTIKRTIGAFGTLFNNIIVRRQTAAGAVLNQTRVPFSYAPRQKFLARLDEITKTEEQRVAIKLPRMSFEITGISFDTNSALNRMNKKKIVVGDTSATRVFQSVPNDISITLSVVAKNQDDALQIVEQILPTFAPEYTLSLKDLEGAGSRTDVPVILTDITPEITYEGDFASRGIIIWTLSFTVKTRFTGETKTQGVITDVDVDFMDFTSRDQFFSEISIVPDSADEAVITFNSTNDEDS